jgi:hypothetical protein
MNFIQISEKYAANREIAHKKAMNKLQKDYSEVNRKDFLKKKTGNGGGFIAIE